MSTFCGQTIDIIGALSVVKLRILYYQTIDSVVSTFCGQTTYIIVSTVSGQTTSIVVKVLCYQTIDSVVSTFCSQGIVLSDYRYFEHCLRSNYEYCSQGIVLSDYRYCGQCTVCRQTIHRRFGGRKGVLFPWTYI